MDIQTLIEPRREEIFELGRLTPDGRSVISALDPSSTSPGITSTANSSRALVTEEGRRHLNESSLPPVDHGWHAWSYLAGAFIFEGISLGLITSFGVFQNYFNSTPPFAGNKSISVIGSIASGIPYLLAPFMTQLLALYPILDRKLLYAGLLLKVLGCIGASFAGSVAQLIPTLGVTYGLGVALAYIPVLGYINEWFVKRRGLASGIMFGGAGLSGLVLPVLFEKSLSGLGYRLTLRVWGCLLAVTLAPNYYFLVRGRLPDSHRTARRRVNYSFFKNPFFLLIALANFFQGLAYFIPSIYLPSYAADLQISSLQSTLLLSFLNLSTTLGQSLSGHLSDKLGSTLPFFLSTFVAGLSICIIWGLSKSFVPLFIFSMVYGISAGGYSVLYPKFAWEVAADDPHTQLFMVGFLYFERGIGNVLSGPISSLLIGSRQQVHSYAISKYEAMVLFTGLTMSASCVSIVGRFMRRR